MRINKLANYEVATVAVAILDGDTDIVHPEDIAIKVNSIAPGRFNWRKYPEQIDLDTVRVALRDAKKSKNGSLVIGTNTDGWMLSPTGISWFQQFDTSNEELSDEFQHRKDSININRDAECVRLRNTKTFKLFKDGKINSVELHDFYQFARVNEYFKEKSRSRRYSLIENAIANDKELGHLWELLKKKFSQESV